MKKSRESEVGTKGFVGRRAVARAESGFTLSEVLVAVTVMAVLFVVAFSLYDSLQKSFKLSENAATEQQNTRVAFDRMVSDVRMAGFNFNPDGDTDRPDEQIEGMWNTAVTVRGDYDFEDASLRTTPESTLGGSSATFKTVSTGNDEIVTYALGKPSGTGGSSISFVADVSGVPRDGTQETVTISNVALAQTDPPYTLYRYIVSPNSTTVVKQPVADNIKSMQFVYYSGANDPNTGTPTVITAVGGAEDTASKAARKSISKVGIQVVGMTEDPDLAYIDPTDASSPTRHYRKFVLETDVTPRNLGMVGVVDIDLDDPNAPANFTACQGHCNGTYLKWTDPGDLDIGSYTVSWGTSASTLTNVISTPDKHYYISGITGPHYYAARSVDFVGNQSSNVMVGPSTPTDTTTPAQVTGAGCSGDTGNVVAAVNDKINVGWSQIGSNTVNLSCDESPYPIRDLAGYKVYKGATSGFDPNVPAQVLQTFDPNTIGTNSALADANIVNCRRYYYKVQGVDLCSKAGAVSTVANGSSTASARPAAPTAVSAIDMGNNTHRVTWNRVTTNSAMTPVPILIDKYGVYRAVVLNGDDPNLATYSQVFNGPVSNPVTPDFQDTSVTNVPNNQSYYYRITALDDCPGNESGNSLPDQADKCVFGGNVTMNVVPGGSTVAGTQTISLSATGGVTIQSTQLIIKESSTGTVVFSQTDATAPYTYSWNSAAVSAGLNYEIIGLVTNASGCTDSTSTTVTVAAAFACCVSTNNPNLSPTTGSLKNNEVYFNVINNCSNDVHIQDLAVNFTNNAGQGALLDTITYNVLSAVTSARAYNLFPDLPSIAFLDFGSGVLSPQLELRVANNAASPVRLKYAFTQPMLNKVGPVFIGESIRTGFFFTVTGQTGIGRCEVTVVTNPLSLVACDPASDPNCGL